MRRAQATVFAAFFLMGMVRAAPSLRWPMVYDDLHLIRAYTPVEIAASWHGNWDPDGIETPGFRPGSLLFNHVRARLCGESVVAHRTLLIVLYAAFAMLLVPVAARFGAGPDLRMAGREPDHRLAGPATVLLAGAVMLAARYEVYGYVWITDGNHMLQGLAFAGGAMLLLDGLDRGDSVRLGLSLACLAAGLLVREDTLAIVPVVLLLGLADLRRQRRPIPPAFYAYAAVLALACAGLLAYRAVVVPEAAAPGGDVRSVLVAIVHVLNPVGIQAFGPGSRMLSLAGWAVLAAFAAALVRFRKEVEWRGPALWLAAALISCTPALNVQRDDLLFFPGTFVALFYATAAATLAKRPGAAGRLAMGGLAVLIMASGYMGIRFAENFHPDSSRALWWNMQMLHGDFSHGATIPPARREAAIARLEQLGIRAGEQPRQRVRELASEARAAGRRRPSPDHAVFVPLLPEGF